MAGRLLLIGGGHAHLRVLEERVLAGGARMPATLVSSTRFHHYSGMVPGFLQGQYAEAELRFDLEALCARAGVEFVEATADRITVDEEHDGGVAFAAGGRIPFRMASLDIGSVPAGIDRPGVREHAMSVRPIARAVELRERLDERLDATADGGRVRIVVVGAGLGGFEVALALDARVRAAGRTPEVHLLDSGRDVLPGFSARVRRRVRSILDSRGVTCRTDKMVTEIEAAEVVLDDGGRIASDLTVWLTGPAPPPMLAASNLPLSTDGFFLVDSTLKAVNGAPVWGAGDCIALAGHPEMPRAGVFAVRQAPVLAANLAASSAGSGFTERGGARVSGRPRKMRGLLHYEPQSGFLSLMNTGRGHALLRWKSLVLHGRGPWWLKDWIDRRFVRRYQQLERR